MGIRIGEMFDEGHEIVGWLGMLNILVAYAGVSIGFLVPTELLYQLANGIGALALLYSAWKTRSYPVVGLNIAWLIIALYALVQML